MNVVCLGWGSLIWDQRGLPVSSLWRSNGPTLPVEFARESQDGRITLVVAKDVVPVTVLWTDLSSGNVEEAKFSLAKREGISGSNIKCSVGFWSPDNSSSHLGVDAIAAWAQSSGIEAVVWTALKPGFKSSRGAVPSLENILEHLQGLSGEARRKAEEYVRNTPTQIQTSYRTAFEKERGWTQRETT